MPAQYESLETIAGDASPRDLRKPHPDCLIVFGYAQ